MSAIVKTVPKVTRKNLLVGLPYASLVTFEDDAGYWAELSINKAEELISDLMDAIAELENTGFVQVRLSTKSSGSLWTYFDPSGELEVDDVVQVPFGLGDQPRLAFVAKVGRGGYTGPIKNVLAKLERTEL